MSKCSPVLYFERSDRSHWYLLALVIAEKPVSFSAPQGVDRQFLIATWQSHKIYGFRFSLKRQGIHRYQCQGEDYEVHVPEYGAPLQLAMSSCNGWEQEDLSQPSADRHRIWQTMWQRHQHNPYHLILPLKTSGNIFEEHGLGNYHECHRYFYLNRYRDRRS